MACVLCGNALPADRRWAFLRWLMPRPAMHHPPTEECYRTFAQRMGFEVTDAEVKATLYWFEPRLRR